MIHADAAFSVFPTAASVGGVLAIESVLVRAAEDDVAESLPPQPTVASMTSTRAAARRTIDERPHWCMDASFPRES
jgi:hypothetical protein